jgi:hypothetical protein
LKQITNLVTVQPLALGTEAHLPARHFLLGTVAAFCLVLGGCDKQSQSSPTSADAAYSGPPTPAPQDQSLKELPLVSMPVILSVPQDWKLEPRDNPAFLEGAAPDGDVQISLSMMDAMSENTQRAYIATSLDQSRKHPLRIQIRQSTTGLGLQVLERVIYANRSGGSADQSPPATEPSEPLAWSIILFVPLQKKFIPCRFDLLKLTQQQYDDDRQFIESMIDSAQAADLAAFK